MWHKVAVNIIVEESKIMQLIVKVKTKHDDLIHRLSMYRWTACGGLTLSHSPLKWKISENSLGHRVGGSLRDGLRMGEVVPACTLLTYTPIPSHCAVIIPFKSISVHQLL